MVVFLIDISKTSIFRVIQHDEDGMKWVYERFIE